jgi:hypothetical protein
LRVRLERSAQAVLRAVGMIQQPARFDENAGLYDPPGVAFPKVA